MKEQRQFGHTGREKKELLIGCSFCSEGAGSRERKEGEEGNVNDGRNVDGGGVFAST